MLRDKLRLLWAKAFPIGDKIEHLNLLESSVFSPSDPEPVTTTTTHFFVEVEYFSKRNTPVVRTLNTNQVGRMLSRGNGTQFRSFESAYFAAFNGSETICDQLGLPEKSILKFRVFTSVVETKKTNTLSETFYTVKRETEPGVVLQEADKDE